MKIKLLTDSTACLSKDFYNQEDIEIVESLLMLDGELKRDISDIERIDFLYRINKMFPYPWSSQADPKDVNKIFEKAISDGFEEIFYIGVSKNITNQFETVEFVSFLHKEMIKTTLYQCGYMGASQGGMVLIANKMLKNGKSVEEIIKTLDDIKENIKTIIVLESSKYLFKTGKIKEGIFIQPTIKYLAKFKWLKPIVEIKLEEGVIGVDKSIFTRTAIKKAINIMNTELSHEIEYNLIFSLTRSKKYCTKIEKIIKKSFNVKEVQYWQASPVVVWAIGAKSIKFTLIPHF